MGYVQITLDGKRPIKHVKTVLAEALCNVFDYALQPKKLGKVVDTLQKTTKHAEFPLNYYDAVNVSVVIKTEDTKISFYPKGFPLGSKYYLTVNNEVYELTRESEILEIKDMFHIFLKTKAEIERQYFDGYFHEIYAFQPIDERKQKEMEYLGRISKIIENAKKEMIEYAKD